MPVVSTYQITRSATPFKTRGRPPFTPTGLSAGNKGLATSKNSSGIKPVAIAHLLVHGFMRQVCTRKSHAKFGFCQRFLIKSHAKTQRRKDRKGRLCVFASLREM